jgi:hypothetical protein
MEVLLQMTCLRKEHTESLLSGLTRLGEQCLGRGRGRRIKELPSSAFEYEQKPSALGIQKKGEGVVGNENVK